MVQPTTIHTMPVTYRRSKRPVGSATASMAAGLVATLCLIAAGDSFVVPVRAMHTAHNSPVKPSSDNGVTGPEGRQGSRREVVDASGGGMRKSSAGGNVCGMASAAASEGAVADVDVLGDNEGVLDVDQRKMARTLLELGQVRPCAFVYVCVYV